MIILIDARGVEGDSWKRGIGVVAKNILRVLHENLTGHQVYVLTAADLSDLDLPSFNQVRNPIKADLLFVLDPLSISTGIESLLPRRDIAPVIWSIFYDAIPVLFNNSYKSWPVYVRLNYRERLFNYLPACDRVFCISSEALRQYYEVNPKTDNAITFPIGLDGVNFNDEESSPESTELFNSIMSGQFPYIITVGGADPHKCLPLMREAFAVAKPYCPNLKWLHVGQPSGYTEFLNLNSVPGIITTGYLEPKHLTELLESPYCLALGSPSYIEGLGLPVYEAVKRKQNILICNIPAYSEIVVTKLERTVSAWAEAFNYLYQCYNLPADQKPGMNRFKPQFSNYYKVNYAPQTWAQFGLNLTTLINNIK